jgi:hypothetical protein
LELKQNSQSVNVKQKKGKKEKKLKNKKEIEHVCFKNQTMGLAHSPKIKVKQAGRSERHEAEPPHSVGYRIRPYTTTSTSGSGSSPGGCFC